MTKVKAINLGYHVTDYDTLLSRELLCNENVLFLSMQPYDWFPMHLRDSEQAHQYVVQYDFKRKLVLTDSGEFLAFTDLPRISDNYAPRFTLSEHGRKIAESMGIDCVEFQPVVGELHEIILLRPREQVLTISELAVVLADA